MRTSDKRYAKQPTDKAGPQERGDKFEPAKIAKISATKAKSEVDKGQNIAQNTRNQGYQQDR